MWEVLLEATIDTLKIVPVLYLVYLVVEWLGHHNNEKFYSFIKRTKKTGPVMGSVLGLVPQCGFSSVMSDLYSKRKITLGTLFAVFLATSDEALPIFLAHPSSYVDMLILLAVKFVCAILFGFAVDLAISLIKRKSLKKIEEQNQPLPHHHKNDHNHCDCHKCCADNIFLEALKHTAWIVLFIFVANVVLGEVIYFVGEENFASALNVTGFFQPFIAALVGLIPNCAGSVVLVETYLAGGITFASCVAGLSAGSGVGLLVLFRKNKPWWHNILITFGVYLMGVATGYLVMFFGWLF